MVYRVIKRGLDILCSALVLLLLWPLMAAVALLILAQRDGSALFRQKRPGAEGKLFTCCKFRTMRAEQHPGESDMDRLTKVGRYLRRFSLDELPQLWNILRGEMSFVGPRPLLPEYMDYYSEAQRRRHDTRPGLTGWAQVNGRNALDWETRLQLDCWYVEHQSFGLDLKILFMTIGKSLSGEGVNADEAQTVERFSDYVLRRRAAEETVVVTAYSLPPAPVAVHGSRVI